MFSFKIRRIDYRSFLVTVLTVKVKRWLSTSEWHFRSKRSFSDKKEMNEINTTRVKESETEQSDLENDHKLFMLWTAWLLKHLQCSQNIFFIIYNLVVWNKLMFLSVTSDHIFLQWVRGTEKLNRARKSVKLATNQSKLKYLQTYKRQKPGIIFLRSVSICRLNQRLQIAISSVVNKLKIVYLFSVWIFILSTLSSRPLGVPFDAIRNSWPFRAGVQLSFK